IARFEERVRLDPVEEFPRSRPDGVGSSVDAWRVVDDLDAANIHLLLNLGVRPPQREAIEEVEQGHPTSADFELHMRDENIGDIGPRIEHATVEWSCDGRRARSW